MLVGERAQRGGTAVTAVPSHPRLKPWYRLARSEEKVVLEYAQRAVVFEGRAARTLLPALLPLLDGRRTIDDLAARLGEPVRPAVVHALEVLGAHGLLLDGPALDTELPQPVRETVEQLVSTLPKPDADGVHERLARASVTVVGASRLADEVARSLSLSGVETRPGDSVGGGRREGELVVCAPAAPELPRLEEWNAQALETGTPWLQALPFDGRYGAVGPLFVPGDTCCYRCFQIRRASNLDYAEEFWPLASVPAPYPSSGALELCLAGLAAFLALRWLLIGDHYVPAAFYALEVGTKARLAPHYVHRVPRCPACAALEDRSPPLPWFKEARRVAG